MALLLLISAFLAGGASAAGPASELLVVMPGQDFIAGTGVTGTPDPVTLRVPFVVRLVAVDRFGNVDYQYGGPLVNVAIPADVPPPGAPDPAAPQRLATAVSGAGAATSLTSGTLSLALYRSPFRDLDLGSPATGGDICTAIQSEVMRPPELQFQWGRPLQFKCIFESFASRYTMFVADGRPLRAKVSVGLTEANPDPRLAFEPTAGSAPLLKLGAPTPLLDPNEPDDYWPRRLDPQPLSDLSFSRGNAFFRMQATSFSAVGPGQVLAVDQGAAPALTVLASPFEVLAPTLSVAEATLLGDGNGNITQVKIEFNEGLDPAAPPINPGEFSLLQLGLPPLAGTSVSVSPGTSLGYEGDILTVTFGSGLGKTDIQDVEVRYGSPTGLFGASTGTPLSIFSLSSGLSPALIDGAPPVLVNTFSQDTDGNNGLDLLRLDFSEPIAFSAGRGVSSAPLTVDATVPVIPVPSFLNLTTVERGAATQTIVTVLDPDDPAATSLSGAPAITAAIAQAVRGSHPSRGGFEAAFESGRYVLASGTSGSGSSVAVTATGGPDDLAVLLDFLGQGAIEENGTAEGLADLGDWVVLSSDGRFNLLEGLTPGDFVIDVNTITIFLNNTPNSGTGAPVFFFKDHDRASIQDKAATPSASLERNNLGLPVGFHPRELLTEALSTPGPDLTLLLTVNPGALVLDASQSIPPLTSRDDDAIVDFSWRQVSGPLLPVPPAGPVVSVVPLVADTYVFELTVTVVDGATLPPLLNRFVEFDGTLRRLLQLTVLPGPVQDLVVLLPGQTLVPGVSAPTSPVQGLPFPPSEAVGAGVPFSVTVTAVDAFGNVVPGTAGSVALTTASSLDPQALVTPGPQPLDPGGTVTFSISHLLGEPDVTLQAAGAGLTGPPSSAFDVTSGPQFQSVIVLPGQTLSPGRATLAEAVTGTPRVATQAVPYYVDVFLCDEFFNLRDAPPGTQIRLTTTDPDDVELPFVPVTGSGVTIPVTPSGAATLFTPEIDDEVLVAFEHGDVRVPYVVGSLWNTQAEQPLGVPPAAEFTWDQDPRATRWNIYRVEGTRASDFDLDRDGDMDFIDFFCLTSLDPDPTDTSILDAEVPDPGQVFLYMGAMVLDAFGVLQETSLGLATTGNERIPTTACPLGP